MMNNNEFATFLNGLGRALAPLPPNSQLAFSAACCERHFANYPVFQRKHQWGDAETLREALNHAWAVVAGDGNGSSPRDLLAKCMSAIPDSEGFSTSEAGYAQDLAIMVTHLVEFMIEDDVKYIVMTATLARDLIDAKIQTTEGIEASDPLLEQKIAGHPMMRAEFEFQRQALARLGEIESRDQLQAFRRGLLQAPGP